MANNTPIQDIFEKYRFDRNISRKSTAWFQQQALLLSKKGITPNKMLKNDPARQLSFQVICICLCMMPRTKILYRTGISFP